jgi:hypothetical protein
MTTSIFRILIGIVLIVNTIVPKVSAQEALKDTNKEKKSRPFQFTFIYPLGTNGINSKDYSNVFSLNLLGGLNGGVDAVEIGAFANINHGDVNGFQGAGFTNINIGKTNGVQAAGFYNQSKELTGGQFAGFMNLNTGNTDGIMAAGFLNVVRGNVKGWQIAGFANTTTKSTDGAQLSGFGNFSKDDVKGAQISGFINLAKNIDGAQAAGFINLAENVEGAQVAGFINVAKKVKGVQIGVFNIADSVDGAPIGVFSFVRHGYRRFEVGASESLFANVSFKTGTEHFYNILTVGFKQVDDDTYWSYGYGVGTMFALTSRMNLNLDAICQQINENEWHTNRVNLLNTLKLNLSYKFTDRIELVAGPSYNVMVSEFDFREGIGTRSKFVPWCFYDKNHNDVNVKMFVGVNAALRF